MAQTHNYQVATRSSFLAGCLTDNPPNFNDKKEVFYKMRSCVCLLDKFQGRYTEQQFISLFDGMSKNQSQSTREVENFVKKHIPSCL